MRVAMAFILITIISVPVVGCSGVSQPEPVSERRFLLDTLCQITIYSDDAQALLSEAFDLIEHYESLFSVTLHGSDIWRINQARGEPTEVSPETLELIRASLEYSAMSYGMFDITVGRLSSLWDFTGRYGVPSELEIEFAVDTVDFRQVVIEGNTITLENPEAWLDLGGIAKGFIADRVADFLRERGVLGAVIDLGGDVVVIGEKPDSTPWRIGVRHPFDEETPLMGVLETYEAAVITSGIYERRFKQDGAIYHHILDPNTGVPVITEIVSVTVISESALTGDALTLISLMVGTERAIRLLNQAPGVIGALLILEDGELIKIGDINFKT